MHKWEITNQFLLVRDYCRAGYRKVVVGAIGMSLLDGIRPFITTVLLGYLLDAVYAGAALPELFRIMAVALGLECFCYCASSILTEIHNQRHEYIYEQQNGLLNRRLLTMDYEHLEDPKVHATIHSIRNAGTDHGLIGLVLDDWKKIIKAVTAIVAAVVIAIPLFTQVQPLRDGFLNSWLASLLLFAVIIGLVYFSFQIDVRYGERIREAHKRRSVDENLLEYYMGIFESCEKQKDLRINGQRELIETQTGAASDRICREVDTEAGLAAKEEMIRRSATAVIGLLVYVFAGLRAYLGLITIGGVVTYASGIIKMSSAMADLMSVMAAIKSHAGYCRDYAEFRRLDERKNEGSTAVEKRKDKSFSVEFDHVSFRYPGSNEDVIRDLSLRFVIGEKMAIVGKNGSGKTTFIKLLCRLYDVTQGCIRVNGKDIREYDEQEYYDLLAVVFQDFRVFAFDLGENIAGNEAPDSARAWDALEKAGLGKRFEGLSQGLHTYVGKEYDSGGVNFSGGERQKIAIARAIYKDAPFVVMDEPTAALDPVSEYEVFAGFDRMVGNKTAMYISHRLASCRFCQDILVFDSGRVIQRGSHEELIGQDGLYRELWNAQAQYYARENDG